jgi:hypothetical protein
MLNKMDISTISVMGQCSTLIAFPNFWSSLYAATAFPSRPNSCLAGVYTNRAIVGEAAIL